MILHEAKCKDFNDGCSWFSHIWIYEIQIIIRGLLFLFWMPHNKRRRWLHIIKFKKVVDKTKIIIIRKKYFSFLNSSIINMIYFICNKLWFKHIYEV